MTVYSFNPLEDSRWTEFVQRHPLASVFHSSEWLEVLRRTYGYESVAYSTSPPKAILTNAVVFSRVNSWLTGRRLVSLPFADHCEPLVERAEDRAAIFLVLRDSFKKGLWKSIEMRLHGSDARGAADLSLSDPYCFHTLDLRPSLAELFQGFHKNCIQRKIRRAEREGLSYEEGRSDELLEKFYRLLLLTRRRHSLPPQPIEWFRNLIACMGHRVTISVASRNRRALGSLITLRHNDALVYKYGASDARFHQFGTMPFLFWKMIQNGKETGIREIDLGRSDLDGAGLMTFKDRLGATRSTSTYLRYAAPNTKSTTDRHLVRAAEQVFDRLPDKALVIAGRLLYRHVG